MPRCTLQRDEADRDSAGDIKRVRTELKWLTGWSCNVLVKCVSKPVNVFSCSYSNSDSACGDEWKRTKARVLRSVASLFDVLSGYSILLPFFVWLFFVQFPISL